MKRILSFLVVTMVMVATSACSDMGLEPVDAPQFSRAASPNTVVTGTIEVAGATIRESGPSNNGSGTCEAGGAYRNNGGNVASSKPHEQCMSTGAAREVNLTFSATYVLASSGNVQLNFGTVCDPEDAASCSKTFLHYKKNGDSSAGAGSFFGNDGGVWEILLGNVSAEGNIVMPGVRVPARHGGEHYIATLNW
jgi:hypothetical protein